MTYDITPFSKEFQSDVVMEGCVQWFAIYGWINFQPLQESNSVPLDQQASA